ncbi:C-type lectin BpLec-like [Anomaloglossus baeobatrachus]|uniref:C-type lectin BpLec-like n=1 Tax=Anomaloglossus baeobatrachus TaxID=238106 RepID=UPI003F4F74DF
MWKLLLLLLVGMIYAQESGDYAQKNNQMIKDKFHGSFEEYKDEDGPDGEDFSLGQDSDRIKPDFTVKAEDDACPDKVKCVYQLFTTHKSYNDAEKVCRNWSGHLTSIHHFKSNSFVQGYLMKHIRNNSYVWIGVWKPYANGSYCNIDGRKLDYTNFEYNHQRVKGRWCVAMDISNGLWYSFHCRSQLAFVCTY